MTDFIASAAGGFGRLKIQNLDMSGDIQAKNARKEHPPQLVIDSSWFGQSPWSKTRLRDCRPRVIYLH